MWIGYYNSSNHSKFKAESGYITFGHCPLWYCNNKLALKVNETYFDQESQCNNRHGILCGACKKPKSLAIASIKCVTCENYQYNYLPLIIFGILAITIVVLFLMLCLNITITHGTISGLLFYVSIFSISRETL